MISGTGADVFTGLLRTAVGVTVLEISCGVAISFSLIIRIKRAKK